MKLTKKSKFLAAILVILILIGAGISIYKNLTPVDDSPADDISTQKPADDANSTWMLGDWYSTREQGDHLILNEDGTFASDWLGDGTYTANMHHLHLTGPLNLTADLTYNEDSDILICDDKKEPHSYYRTEELMQAAVNDGIKADQTSSAALDAQQLLQMGTWETKTGPKSHLTFDGKRVTNNEPDSPDNPVNQTYEYVIDSAEYSENQPGLILVNMTIVLNDEEHTLNSGKIGLENTGDGIYKLTKYTSFFLSSGNKWYLDTNGGK